MQGVDWLKIWLADNGVEHAKREFSTVGFWNHGMASAFSSESPKGEGGGIQLPAKSAGRIPPKGVVFGPIIPPENWRTCDFLGHRQRKTASLTGAASA
jgi:hypothetical protein